jgi:hypothetical protein
MMGFNELVGDVRVMGWAVEGLLEYGLMKAERFGQGMVEGGERILKSDERKPRINCEKKGEGFIE